jgi:hypothetical protein
MKDFKLKRKSKLILLSIWLISIFFQILSNLFDKDMSSAISFIPFFIFNAADLTLTFLNKDSRRI